MNKVTSIVAVLAISISLASCAIYKPVPDGYTGPVAMLADSGFSEDGTKAQLFSLMEVDGNAVQSSFGASASASYGQGFALTTRIVSRPIPAKPMKVKLKGAHTTGAPIHAIFSQMSGTFFSVEGIADFDPVPGGDYVVKGTLKKNGSLVWIEDVRTGEAVTRKISGSEQPTSSEAQLGSMPDASR